MTTNANQHIHLFSTRKNNNNKNPFEKKSLRMNQVKILFAVFVYRWRLHCASVHPINLSKSYRSRISTWTYRRLCRVDWQFNWIWFERSGKKPKEANTSVLYRNECVGVIDALWNASLQLNGENQRRATHESMRFWHIIHNDDTEQNNNLLHVNLQIIFHLWNFLDEKKTAQHMLIFASCNTICVSVWLIQIRWRSLFFYRIVEPIFVPGWLSPVGVPKRIFATNFGSRLNIGLAKFDY